MAIEKRKVLQWITQLNSISDTVLQLLPNVPFKRLEKSGHVITTLEPTISQLITIEEYCVKYSDMLSAVSYEMGKYPIQRDQFLGYDRDYRSYLRFERTGGNIEEHLWKKLFVQEFSQKTQGMISIFKEIYDQLNSRLNYKCFRTSEECNVKIEYNPKSVFVIMPFARKYQKIYEQGIKKPLEELGYTVIRSDEIFHTRDILCVGICKPIQEAGYVLADLSGCNANVFFELGIAYGFEKDVILVVGSQSDVPFDLRGMNLSVYNNNPKRLEEILKARVIPYSDSES